MTSAINFAYNSNVVLTALKKQCKLEKIAKKIEEGFNLNDVAYSDSNHNTYKLFPLRLAGDKIYLGIIEIKPEVQQKIESEKRLKVVQGSLDHCAKIYERNRDGLNDLCLSSSDFAIGVITPPVHGGVGRYLLTEDLTQGGSRLINLMSGGTQGLIDGKLYCLYYDLLEDMYKDHVVNGNGVVFFSDKRVLNLEQFFEKS